MHCMMTVDRKAERLVRGHHYWMGILMMSVGKQTIKIIYLANCCVGEAEPAGQTAMRRRWRRSNVKQVKVIKWCLNL